jgi:GAF domain-containing protein
VKILNGFPTYTSGNCDFVTKRADVPDGEQVVVLDVDVDNLPSGMLCLHTATVRQIIHALGWSLFTDADGAALDAARAEAAAAIERLDDYTEVSQLLAALERVDPSTKETKK